MIANMYARAYYVSGSYACQPERHAIYNCTNLGFVIVHCCKREEFNIVSLHRFKALPAVLSFVRSYYLYLVLYDIVD